jgi:hypothetical protein
MKEKERARMTNANRVSGGIVLPSPKGDTRVSLKFAGNNVADTTIRRTQRDAKTEKLVKTPANSAKIIDNSTAAGISNIGDITARSH